MKKLLIALLTVSIVFGLVACSNGFGSLNGTVKTIEKALENNDSETINKLLHDEADVIFENFDDLDAEEFLEDFLDEISDEYNDIDFKIEEETPKGDWKECFEEIEEIIDDENLDIDMSKAVLFNIDSYSGKDQIDDGFMILCKSEAKWKILIIYPMC